METVESLLREKFQRPVEVDSAWVSDLIANTGHLRHRRTIHRTAMASLAVVVVVAVVAVGVGIGSSHAVRPSGPVYPIPAIVDVKALNNPRPHPATVPMELDLADGKHGFALFLYCPGKDKAGTCSDQIRATSDGGRTFALRTPPPDWNRGSSNTMTLFVFDADHVVLEDQPSSEAGVLPDVNQAGWMSSDGARTWQRVAQVPISRTDHIPAGALLAWSDGADSMTGLSRMLAIDRTGALTDFSSHPIGVIPWTKTTIDGSYFAWSSDGFFVSLDGRTWRRATVPEDFTQMTFSPIGSSGTRIYAEADDKDVGVGGIDRQEILVSDDRGVTWSRVPLPPLTPLVTPKPSDGLGTIDQVSDATTTSGGLVINDMARTWRLAPGASAFVPDDQAFPIVSVSTYGSFMLAYSFDINDPKSPLVRYLSTDGVHWQPAGY